MLRSRFLLGCAAFMLAPWWLARTGKAQPISRMAVIGYIAQRAGPWHLDAAFLDAMRELGYVEGRHFRMDYRWGPNADDLPALAADLVRLRVDVIVSSGYSSNRAAKDATSSVPIPIVMATSGDAVQEGLVATLARPGGNITGREFSRGHRTGLRPFVQGRHWRGDDLVRQFHHRAPR